MKIGLLGLFIILTFSCNTAEQNYKENINETVDLFIKTKNLGDYQKLITLMPNELFEIYPIANAINMWTKADQQNGFMRINNFKITDYGQFLHNNNKIYTKLKYEAIVANERKEPYSDFLLKYMQKEFGDNNVTFDSTSHSYLINNTSYLVAIGEQDGKTWKYLEYNPKMGDKIMTLIIPLDIWEKLK